MRDISTTINILDSFPSVQCRSQRHQSTRTRLKTQDAAFHLYGKRIQEISSSSSASLTWATPWGVASQVCQSLGKHNRLRNASARQRPIFIWRYSLSARSQFDDDCLLGYIFLFLSFLFVCLFLAVPVVCFILDVTCFLVRIYIVLWFSFNRLCLEVVQE